ncbi:hypothetical protein AB0O31_19635 [Kitasatospora cineracea]|uniref:hypothetical protein n=1 Tax=Kitasatospora cineracea TaxID=88074 RepID=UPI003439B59C
MHPTRPSAVPAPTRRTAALPLLLAPAALTVALAVTGSAASAAGTPPRDGTRTAAITYGTSVRNIFTLALTADLP